MRIAIYENLPPGGAKRTSFEFGRYLARQHEVDLYRLSITNNRLFDMAPFVRRVYRYPYAPFGGLLNGRLTLGHYAPRSVTLFGPLKRLHRRIAADIRSRGYDRVLAHTDSMTQSPYLLRWLDAVPGLYYCQEVLRIRDERAAQEAHRRQLMQSGFPVGRLRVMEDTVVRRRLAPEDAANVAAATAVLVNSKYSRERVWAAYGRDATVCYLGVDPEIYRPDPTVARQREVLSIGSPPNQKGHPLVIQALARIPDDRRPALRVVTPNPVDAMPLQRLASDRNVRLTVEHGLDDSTLADRYRSVIATVCAARLEPFGLTALESMACATPVIAVDEGGFRESVRDGVTGLLVEPQTGALARAIESLIDRPEQIVAMGNAGRAWVTDAWTWEHAGRRLERELEASPGEASLG